MHKWDMMTSSNGNIFRVTGHLCGEFTGLSVNSPHKGQWRGALMFSLICVWSNGWANNREAGDFRRSCVHCDVIVMITVKKIKAQPTTYAYRLRCLVVCYVKHSPWREIDKVNHFEMYSCILSRSHFQDTVSVMQIGLPTDESIPATHR